MLSVENGIEKKGWCRKNKREEKETIKKSSKKCVKINQCFTPIVTGKYKFDFKAMKLKFFLFKTHVFLYFKYDGENKN